MKNAKVFQNGRSQAVRLPKEFRFDGDCVYIKRVGDAAVLYPIPTTWKPLLDSLSMFSEDFMEERIQPPLQIR